jgi:hypothetical protein
MSIELLRAVGMVVWLPSFMELDTAESLLADALATEAATGARYWAAELLRQQGLVDLARGDRTGLDRLRAAAAVAAEQGATLLELRALIALVRETGAGPERAALAALVAELGGLLDDLPVEGPAARALR